MKIIYSKQVTYLVIMALMIACNGKGSDAARKQLIIPSTLESYTEANAKNSVNPFTEKQPTYKIYTLIDASCSTCLEKFKKWNEFYARIQQRNNCQLIAVCYSKDNFELLKYLFENNEIDPINYSVMLDTHNEFQKLNATHIENAMAFAVLTDEKNNVLEIGYPIVHTQDQKNFISKINTIE